MSKTPKWMLRYSAIEVLLAQIIDLDFELDVLAEEEEMFLSEGHGDGVIIEWNIKRHLLYILKIWYNLMLFLLCWYVNYR